MSGERTDTGTGNVFLHHPGDPLCPVCTLFSEDFSPELSTQDNVVVYSSCGDQSLYATISCTKTHGTGRSRAGREPEPMYDILVDGSGDGHSIALFPGEEVFFSYERGASNNDAEFNAVILALENLPQRAHARICTDSQVVVWHLSAKDTRRNARYLHKKVQIEELISSRHLKVEIQWIPRRENRADRFLKHYIASLCGAQGREPLHHRVRRLEVENLRLKSKLKKAMKMLENRPVAIRDEGIQREGMGIRIMLTEQ